MSGQLHAPAALYPRERPGTHCTEGWVGPTAGLNRCGKSRPQPRFDPRTVQPVAQSLYRLSYPAHCSELHKRTIRLVIFYLVCLLNSYCSHVDQNLLKLQGRKVRADLGYAIEFHPFCQQDNQTSGFINVGLPAMTFRAAAVWSIIDFKSTNHRGVRNTRYKREH